MARPRRPAASPLARRRFLRQAGGALATGLLLPGLSWNAVYARATSFGIVPGTAVDAQGNPMPFGFSDGYLGEIILFAGNFAPRNTLLCNGALLSISSNTALFSILGTYYGGNGVTTFALPDLRGRTLMGMGQGPGLSDRPLGEVGGEEAATLVTSEMPAHTHTLSTGTGRRRASTAVDVRPTPILEENAYGTDAAGLMALPSTAGASQPHNNMSPYLALNFCIMTQGVFPSRP